MGNFLVGSIPDEIRVLTFLEIFDVSENFLVGTLPTIIDELSLLHTFRCIRNTITGSIPSTQIGEMVRLREFSVSDTCHVFWLLRSRIRVPV